MDVEKVADEEIYHSIMMEELAKGGRIGEIRVRAAKRFNQAALTANGLTVVPVEVVEALRPFAAISEHLSSFDPQDEDIINWGLVPKDFHFAAMQLAKLDQPQ